MSRRNAPSQYRCAIQYTICPKRGCALPKRLTSHSTRDTGDKTLYARHGPRCSRTCRQKMSSKQWWRQQHWCRGTHKQSVFNCVVRAIVLAARSHPSSFFLRCALQFADIRQRKITVQNLACRQSMDIVAYLVQIFILCIVP